MIRHLPWLLASGAWLSAHASALTVQVTDTHGHPVADAVITLDQPAEAGAARTHTIDQKNETFLPYVEVLRPGDQVVFHNSDDTRHHVYSFSPIGKFQFILKPGESSPAQTLDQPGTVSVGCNIHDQMVAYLVVTPNEAKVTSPQGIATFDTLAPGPHQVRLWHPQILPAHLPAAQSVNVTAQGADSNVSFKVDLLPDPRMLDDREHMDY